MNAKKNETLQSSRFHLEKLPERMAGTAPTLAKEQILFLNRKEAAKHFLEPLFRGVSRFGFSKGHFSLIDIIDELFTLLPGGHFTLSTWTAARANLGRLQGIIESRPVASFRLLIDSTFQSRQPALLHALRGTYGKDSIRITKNHAKFLLYSWQDYRLVIRTSMNLNHNPRFENIDLCDNPDLFNFIETLMNHIWESNSADEQIHASTKDLARQFQKLRPFSAC